MKTLDTSALVSQTWQPSVTLFPTSKPAQTPSRHTKHPLAEASLGVGYGRSRGGTHAAAPHGTAVGQAWAAPYTHARCRVGSALSLAGEIPRNPKTLQSTPGFLPLQMRIQPGRLSP